MSECKPLTPRESAGEIAEMIADKIFFHHLDRQRRDELADLLKRFAAQVRQSAIEP